MIDHREPQPRRAAVALLVLLVHVALVWIFLLSLRAPQTATQDGGALQTLILLEKPAGFPEEPPPQIKPDLRMPAPPVPDLDEIPIVVPVDVTNPQAVNSDLSASAAVAAADAAGEGGHESSQGAAAGEGVAGTSFMRGVFPVYPLPSISRREEGSVLVTLTFGSLGKLLAARVQQSSGFAGLDEAALHAMRQWRLQCARRTQPCEITVRVGFALATRPPPMVEPSLLPFDAAWLARVNADAQKDHSMPEGFNGEAMSRLIGRMIDTIGADMYPDASDPSAVRQSPRVYAIVENGPIHLTGTPPWPRVLDSSKILNVRFMGVVHLQDPGVDGVPAASRTWYAFAVRQENSTSEWLLGSPPGSTIRSIEVMAGGPPCTDASRSAACVEGP